MQKYYKRIFIKSGLADYNDYNEGVTLLEKDVIQKALSTIINKPVFITHNNNKKVGKVLDAYYSIDDEAFIVGFMLTDDEAINLLDNKNYSISCTYSIMKKINGGVYHNIPYDEEAKEIVFEDIAIVKYPRYQEANKKINSINKQKIEEIFNIFTNNYSKNMFKRKTNEEANNENVTLEDIFYLLSLVADKIGVDFEEEKYNDKEPEINNINEFLKAKGLSDEDITKALEILNENKVNESKNEDFEEEFENSLKKNSVIQNTLASINKQESGNFKSRLQRIAEANNKYKLNIKN